MTTTVERGACTGSAYRPKGARLPLPWHPFWVTSNAEGTRVAEPVDGSSGRRRCNTSLQRRRVHRGDAPLGACPDLPAVRGDRGRRRVGRRGIGHRAFLRPGLARELVRNPHLGVAEARMRERRGRPRHPVSDVPRRRRPLGPGGARDARRRARPPTRCSRVVRACGVHRRQRERAVSGDFPRHMRGREDLRDGRLVPRAAPPTGSPSTCSCPASSIRRAAFCYDASPTRPLVGSTAGSSPRIGSSSRAWPSRAHSCRSIVCSPGIGAHLQRLRNPAER